MSFFTKSIGNIKLFKMEQQYEEKFSKTKLHTIKEQVRFQNQNDLKLGKVIYY